MEIFIVTRDLGDGDVGLYYFPTQEEASKYIELNQEECWHESNPHYIDTENMQFDEVEED